MSARPPPLAVAIATRAESVLSRGSSGEPLLPCSDAARAALTLCCARSTVTARRARRTEDGRAAACPRRTSVPTRTSLSEAQASRARGTVARRPGTGDPGRDLARRAARSPAREAPRHQHRGLHVVGPLARDFLGRLQRAGGFAARELQTRQLETCGCGARIELENLVERRPRRGRGVPAIDGSIPACIGPQANWRQLRRLLGLGSRLVTLPVHKKHACPRHTRLLVLRLSVIIPSTILSASGLRPPSSGSRNPQRGRPRVALIRTRLDTAGPPSRFVDSPAPV